MEIYPVCKLLISALSFAGACGPKGRCYNLDGGLAGYRCVCPLGKTGAGCQMGKSYMCYPWSFMESYRVNVNA